MRLKKLSIVFSAVLLFAGLTLAQTSDQNNTGQSTTSDQNTDATQTQPSGNAAEQGAQTQSQAPSQAGQVSGNIVTGKVTAYNPGQSITIRTQNGQTRNFDLKATNMTANIDPSVKVGSRVRMSETTNNGQTTLNVEPYRATHAGARMPKTASNVPLLGLLGLFALAAGAGVRIASKKLA